MWGGGYPGAGAEEASGQKNNLDALCRRMALITSHRELHGALLDSEILADVYLLLTGGQKALMLGGDNDTEEGGSQIQRLDPGQFQLTVLSASEDELAEHQAFLDALESKGGCIWKNIEQGESPN